MGTGRPGIGGIWGAQAASIYFAEIKSGKKVVACCSVVTTARAPSSATLLRWWPCRLALRTSPIHSFSPGVTPADGMQAKAR